MRQPATTDLARLADLACGPMSAQEAAAFLSVTPKRFGQIAPSLPRSRPPGLSYRYYRDELLAWSRGELATGNVPAAPISIYELQHGKRKNHGGKKKTNRLV